MQKITPTIRPLPKQDIAWAYLMDNIVKYILFGGGAGGGKSWLGCEWLIVMCYQYPGTKWFIGRKKLTVLMKSSYVTFQKVCKYHDIPREDWDLNGQYNYIQFKNGSRIDLLDLKENPSDPMFEELGSTEYTGGWIEEAGEIKFKAFDVLKTRIGRHLNKEYNLHPKMLLTCNPKKNWLKRLIWIPSKKGILKPAYAYVQSLYSDNSYTSDIYGEQLDEITDNATRQRLKGGNWNYDDSGDCLIDTNAIQDIWTNTVENKEFKCATIDVARKGKDTTKLYLWRGYECYKIKTWHKADTSVTSTEIKAILAEEQIPYSRVLADEVGIGGGFIDQMKGINGFIANSGVLEDPKAKPIQKIVNGELKTIYPKDNFKTLKDQCGWGIASIINNHKLSITASISEEHREVIEEELSEIKDLSPDKEEKKRLVPKDEIKENIGRSPDDMDCILMRYWFELGVIKNTNQTNLQGSRKSLI